MSEQDLSVRIDWNIAKWSNYLGKDIAVWKQRTARELVEYMGNQLATQAAEIERLKAEKAELQSQCTWATDVLTSQKWDEGWYVADRDSGQILRGAFPSAVDASKERSRIEQLQVIERNLWIVFIKVPASDAGGKE